MPILVPGVGEQCGDLESSVLSGMDAFGTGIILSSSRAVLYASNQEDFAERALAVVLKMKSEINKLRNLSKEARPTEEAHQLQKNQF